MIVGRDWIPTFVGMDGRVNESYFMDFPRQECLIDSHFRGNDRGILSDSMIRIPDTFPPNCSGKYTLTTSSTENGSTTAVYGQVGRDKEWRAGSKPAPTESIFTARARLERIDGSNNAWLRPK